MGIFSFLGGGGASSLIDGVGNILDEVITNDEERATAERLMAELRQRPHLAQIHLNAQEANHRSVFVAGWRPFIGWVCGIAMAYAFILQKFALFLAVMFGMSAEQVALIPEVSIGEMMPVLLGMLGLGAMRSFDKREGSTQN